MTREIKESLQDLMQPRKAFITFNHQESKERILSAEFANLELTSEDIKRFTKRQNLKSTSTDVDFRLF